jgi:hypothetical protein
LVEGIVIVGSILLALAVDQWWEDRELREAEADIIERLAEEFDANAAQLQDKAGGHERALASTEALLKVTGSTSRGELQVDSLSTLIWDFLHTPTYDPEDGVLNSLITSGEMRIITNDDLRTALAGWPSLIRDLKEDEDRAWNHVDQINTFMNRRISFRSLHLSKREDQFQRLSDFPDGLEELLRSREFENLVIDRLFRLETGVIPGVKAVEAGVDSIRALLDLELQR